MRNRIVVFSRFRDYILQKDVNSERIVRTRNINLTKIEARTKKIFERLNHCINTNGLIDATKLAYSFGFKIEEHKGLPDLLNGVITCDRNGNQMAINNNLSKEKKRYSITYLLSAYLLYYQNQDFFDFKHLTSDENLEVSYMTRLLLVPDDVLNHYINDNNQRLSDMFQVPHNVMEQRVQEIKKAKGLVLTKKLTQTKK